MRWWRHVYNVDTIVICPVRLLIKYLYDNCAGSLLCFLKKKIKKNTGEWLIVSECGVCYLFQWRCGVLEFPVCRYPLKFQRLLVLASNKLNRRRPGWKCLQIFKSCRWLKALSKQNYAGSCHGQRKLKDFLRSLPIVLCCQEWKRHWNF